LASGKIIELTFDESIAYIIEFGHEMTDACPTLLPDDLAKRVAEIDADQWNSDRSG
jgi:hypothetical protein